MGTARQRDLLMADSMMREVFRLSINTEAELNIISRTSSENSAEIRHAAVNWKNRV